MKYMLVSDSSLSILEHQVNEYLNNGWELVGTIVVSEDYKYIQAMVKK